MTLEEEVLFLRKRTKELESELVAGPSPDVLPEKVMVVFIFEVIFNFEVIFIHEVVFIFEVSLIIATLIHL